MSHLFGVAIESLVSVLLVLTIGYCMLLNTRLKRLKADEFPRTVSRKGWLAGKHQAIHSDSLNKRKGYRSAKVRLVVL